MNKHLLISVLVIFAAGCASDPLQPGQGSKAAKEIASSQMDAKAEAKLIFFDSRVFDNGLSSAMRSGSPEIVVDVPSRFSLNEIPDRVDRWLYAVKESGGQVKARPERRTRGLVSAAIDLVVSFVGKIDDYVMFRPSENYSATLMYDDEGVVNKMVFKKR